MDRRSFIKFTAGCGISVAALGSISSCSFGSRWGTILGGGKYALQTSGQPQVQQAFVSVTEGNPHLINLSFLPHGIAIDPNHLTRVFTFEKIGYGACEIDLDNQRMVRMIPPGKDRLFYGHGVASPDGNYLYCTETVINSSQGVIAVRDLATLDLVGEFPSYGHAPHDCQLIDDGRVMVITNGGGTLDSGYRPSVAFVEVQTQKLLQKLYLDNERLNTGHLAMVDDGMAVVSAPRAGLGAGQVGGVSLWLPDERMVSMSEPKEVLARLRGEALSVAVAEEHDMVVATHPDADLITFWSLSDREFIDSMELPKPRGVSMSVSGELILSYGPFTRLQKLDLDKFSLQEGYIDRSYISGSHVYEWEREVTFPNNEVNY